MGCHWHEKTDTLTLHVVRKKNKTVAICQKPGENPPLLWSLNDYGGDLFDDLFGEPQNFLASGTFS